MLPCRRWLLVQLLGLEMLAVGGRDHLAADQLLDEIARGPQAGRRAAAGAGCGRAGILAIDARDLAPQLRASLFLERPFAFSLPLYSITNYSQWR